MDLISVSIGVGLAVSLLFSELFGLAAGGMVVPGYIAVYLNRPVDIALTILCALATYFVVHLLSTFIIIYGKRRTVLMILFGFLLRTLFDYLPLSFAYEYLAPNAMAGTTDPTTMAGYGQVVDQFKVIGFIIPGLIAIWIDRQGMVETLSALTAAAVVVRLILILFFGISLNL